MISCAEATRRLWGTSMPRLTSRLGRPSRNTWPAAGAVGSSNSPRSCEVPRQLGPR